MKTVTISTRSKAIAALLKRATRENLILRTPDGREFILAELDDFNREIELTRQSKELMQLLEQRAKQPGAVSLDQVKSELGLS
ncbi:MAG: phage protein [Chloroflexi bacterium]|nr:phage protein [Chloroflexota bacterium]